MSLFVRRRHEMPVILSLKNLIFITPKIVTRLRFAACSIVNMCVFFKARWKRKSFSVKSGYHLIPTMAGCRAMRSLENLP